MALCIFGNVRSAHSTVSIEVNLDLRHDQLERASAHSSSSQHSGKFLHSFEKTFYGRGHTDFFAIRPLQEFIYFLVRKPSTALDR